MENILSDAKKAAKIHKKVRKEIKDYIKPGVKLYDICAKIETRVSELSRNYGEQVNNGIAFPTGISINNVAAHWTPNPGDKTILKDGDICKIDFGTHINGWIIDSAFTINNNPIYDNLLIASKEAVNNVIKNMGPDTLISDLSSIAEEIVTSYEVDVNGKTIPLKPINNLTGHSISQWEIHSGKSIPSVKNDSKERIENNEFYAVEVFPTTGSGTGYLEGKSSHYKLKQNYNSCKFKTKRSGKLLNLVKNNFKTLAFCPRFIYNIEKEYQNYDFSYNELFQNQIINSYPPILDIPGSMVAQFEHTVFISEDKKIILSKSDDY